MEIIIVDSGSTDNTVEIAKKFNARIFTIEWCNDYAFARNVAISKCSGDWIFFLDADEYLESPQNLIRVIKKVKNKNIGGYLVERTDKYRHKENGLIINYPVGLVRLFRNHASFSYLGTVHEQINTTITGKGYRIGILKNSVIIHQVYLSDNEFLELKQRRYLAMIDNELMENSSNFWMHYQKAKTHWFLDEKETAKKIFSTIAIDNNCPLIIQCSAFCNKAVLLMEEGKLDEAILEVNKSLKLNPKQSLGAIILGNILYQKNEFKKSINAYTKVKTSINKLNYNQIIPGDLYTKKEDKKYKIACCYLAMGKVLAAFFLLKRAIKINKEHVQSLLLLARIYASKQSYKSALDLGKECLRLNPGWKQAEDFLNYLNNPISSGRK